MYWNSQYLKLYFDVSAYIIIYIITYIYIYSQTNVENVLKQLKCTANFTWRGFS